MQQLMAVWLKSDIIAQWKVGVFIQLLFIVALKMLYLLQKTGRLFFEPRESNRVSAMLSDYSRVISKGSGKAMLNAVVGGKMSEG